MLQPGSSLDCLIDTSALHPVRCLGGSSILILGFLMRIVLQDEGVSHIPYDRLVDQACLHIYIPWRQDLPVIPPHTGYPF